MDKYFLLGLSKIVVAEYKLQAADNTNNRVEELFSLVAVISNKRSKKVADDAMFGICEYNNVAKSAFLKI